MASDIPDREVVVEFLLHLNAPDPESLDGVLVKSLITTPRTQDVKDVFKHLIPKGIVVSGKKVWVFYKTTWTLQSSNNLILHILTNTVAALYEQKAVQLEAIDGLNSDPLLF